MVEFFEFFIGVVLGYIVAKKYKFKPLNIKGLQKKKKEEKKENDIEKRGQEDSNRTSND